ncbi:hypothetical protein RG959_15390 [Domibacillus sp. 8LH]|uniref:hypothetical protein n=1 Tax=Domibacillus sp. 8LH TaxID=3073900 RepID=UPI003179242D
MAQRAFLPVVLPALQLAALLVTLSVLPLAAVSVSLAVTLLEFPLVVLVFLQNRYIDSPFL